MKKICVGLLFTAISLNTFSLTARGESVSEAPAAGILPPVSRDSLSTFDYQIRNAKSRSSTYWFPLAGFGVPGLPQFLNRQTGAGIIYGGFAATGLGVAVSSAPGSRSTANNDFGAYSDQQKAVSLGLQTYQTMGSLSAYHAFRSTVQQRRRRGDFDFLVHDEETPGDLLLAPFHVSFLTEPSVFLPLGLLAGAVILNHNSGPHGSRSMTWSDDAFTLGTSYNAGVGEEALFRGYLMMNLRQSWQSEFWSLAATATLFSAAHISSDNPFPWPQLIAGFYLGWLTERNEWTLAHSIFVHAWWDVIAIAADLSGNVSSHAVFLPLVDATF